MHNELSNIVICEDHFVTAIGIEFLLREHLDSSTITKVTSGKKALEFFAKNAPDLLIVDLGLPDISGVEVIKELRNTSPESKIIALTGLSDPHILRQVYQLKVNGILKKSNSARNISEALNFLKTNKGATFLDSSVRSILEDEKTYVPTKREYEVLELMSKGHTSEQIAEQLECSLTTVKTYRSRIMAKSGCRNSAEIISWYLKGNGK